MICLPCGQKQALVICSLWPLKQLIYYPFYPFISQINLSLPPVINTFPLGCHWTNSISSAWSGPSVILSLNLNFPSSVTSQMINWLLRPPVKQSLPLWLNSINSTVSVCWFNTCLYFASIFSGEDGSTYHWITLWSWSPLTNYIRFDSILLLGTYLTTKTECLWFLKLQTESSWSLLS